MSTSGRKSGFRFWRVADISVAHYVHDVYSSFLSPLLPLIKEKMGLSYSLLAILPLFGRLPSVFNFLTGLIAERMAIRYFIILTPAITTFSMSLIGLAGNFFELAVLLLLMGWSSAFFHLAGPVMIRRVSGERSGAGMSLYMLAGEAARASGPLLIAYAVEELWGLEGSWKLMPIGLLASLILYFRLRKLEQVEHKSKNAFKGAWPAFSRMLPFFSIITGYTFIRGINRAFITTLLPLFLVDAQGFSVTKAALWLSLSQLGAAGGTLVSGFASDWIGRRRILILIAFISPVFIYLFVHTEAIVQLVMLFIAAFFMAASSPVILAMVNNLNKERQSFTNGIYTTISFAFSAGAIALAGYGIDLFGLDSVYLYAPFFALLTLPFAFMLPKQ